MKKSSRDFANFTWKIVALHCVVSGLTKKNVSRQYLCVEKLLKMGNDQSKQHRS